MESNGSKPALDYGRLFDTIKELVLSHSPSGVEGEIDRELADRFTALNVEHCQDSAGNIAETVLGWNRHSVQRGLHERKTGIICLDNYRARGCHKSESRLPNLEVDIKYNLIERCWAALENY